MLLNAFLHGFILTWIYAETAPAWENGELREVLNSSTAVICYQQTPQPDKYLIDVEVLLEKQNDYENQSPATVLPENRVKIVQELQLTRDAFTAMLEIENGETSEVGDINVEFQITRTDGSSEIANDRFSIGEPEYDGFEIVNDELKLGRSQSGSIFWLVIPYSTAAPNRDTLYNFGAKLAYHADGSDVTLQLSPVTVTVKPSPKLTVRYFHERNAQSNILTSQEKSIVPFNLAVMVINNGYGVARQLNLSHGQPEMLKNENVSPACSQTSFLTVDCGDIVPFETKTAQWLVNSTIKGSFYNYSTTVHSINALEDPQLSLIHDLSYHDMIHPVRIDRDPSDDDLADFLVNDIADQYDIPDKLYDSSSASHVYDVHEATVVNISSFAATSAAVSSITLMVKAFTNQWFYIRFENNITSADAKDKQILQVVGSNRGRLLVGKNVWQTSHILDSFLIHMLDFVRGNPSQSTEVELKYSLIYFPENNAPQFNATEYGATIASDTPINAYVLTVHAYDVEPGVLKFEIKNPDLVPFRIVFYNGRVYVKESPLPVGEIEFEVVISDLAVESKNATTKVHINIKDDISYYTTSHPMTVTSHPVSTSTLAQDLSSACVCDNNTMLLILSLLVHILYSLSMLH